jgi:hypothetical protein
VAYFDVFNGDADGICALHQLRLSKPVESTLITGVKRDISLLSCVEAQAEDVVTVLDISLDKNRDALKRLLTIGAQVQYFDHHFAGDIPGDRNLTATIDTSPDTCTSLLVDQYLSGGYRAWAVVAAFGDNLDESARQAAKTLGVDESRLMQLRDLGIVINYNAYGATVDDLHYRPDQLFKFIQPFRDPFDFIATSDTFVRLRDGYAEDMNRTKALKPDLETPAYALYVLPAQAWARRVSGVLGNQLAQDCPDRAHALLTALPEGGYVVSVRAPLTNKQGADQLCRAFPTGGGRQAAAGINHLSEDLYDKFVAKFKETYA